MHQATPQPRFIEALGWYGVLAILTAYAATSLILLAPTNLWVVILNGTGAAALAWHSAARSDLQPLALNLIWLAIAVAALIHAGTS